MTGLCVMLKDAFSQMCTGGGAEGEGPGGWGGDEREEPCDMEGAGGGGAEGEGLGVGGYMFSGEGNDVSLEVCEADKGRREDVEREQLLALLCGGMTLLKLMR